LAGLGSVELIVVEKTVMERFFRFTLPMVSLLLLPACAMAPYPASRPVAETASSLSTDPKQILQDMARQLATAPGFSVTIRSDYDAIQANGQSIAFGEKREVQLQRPDRVRIDSLRSDGVQGMLLFDGKTVTAFKPQHSAYVQVEKTGTVDDAVVYVVKDLQMTVPLARLLLTTLPQELDKLVTEASYVERDVLMDVPTDHIALRSADVDLQLWVSRSAERLPRRVVITYLHEAGQPQFRAELTDWNLKPCFGKDVFDWTPPAGAERISLSAPDSKPASTTEKHTKVQGVTP
jgi:hypothetical protein